MSGKYENCRKFPSGEAVKEIDLGVNIYSGKLITYIKVVLIAVLVIVEAIVCAQVAVRNDATLARDISIVAACCVALTVIETVDSFVIKKFAAKIAFYCADATLLLVICIFTGNSLLAALYCVVLTQIYMNIEKFSDKLILFGVSCGLYAISFIVGWVLTNAGATIFNSTVEIVSGALLGLMFISLDFIIVQFLLSFYRTNRELSAALKQANDSGARLEEAYRQLSETAVFEERNRIAREIHDNAGHSMTTVIMQTEAAKLMIDKDPAEAKNRIIAANIQARSALEQMRESVHLLAGRTYARPIKEELGEIISRTVDGTDIKVRCDFADVRVSDGGYRFLCSALKECLSNGIRHGGATAFYAELRKDGDNAVLYVSDNGKGVSGNIDTGFGLKNMREMARSLGGDCVFASEEGEGFEVTITLPAADDGEEHPVKED